MQNEESNNNDISPSNDDFVISSIQQQFQQQTLNMFSIQEFLTQPHQQSSTTVLNQIEQQVLEDTEHHNIVPYKDNNKNNTAVLNATEPLIKEETDHNEEDDDEFSYGYYNQRKCYKDYMTIKKDQTPNGLQYDDYKRSQAYYGNGQRLYRFVQGLQTGTKPKKIIVCGGSISIGHGVKPRADRYADRFISWLNQRFPIQQNNTKKHAKKRRQKPKKHELHMKVAHGADVS
jgi:hypothetical protein